MKFVFRVTVVICFSLVIAILFIITRVDRNRHASLDEYSLAYDDNVKLEYSSSSTVSISFNRRITKNILKYRLLWSYDSDKKTHWRSAASSVSSRRVYQEASSELGMILTAMTKSDITFADVGYRGTQLKLSLVLDGQQSVVFKPRWYDRDYTIEGLPYRGHDRHNGEIVAFHLSRLIGLNRVPLAVGRTVDLEKDILPVATERLRNTFFTNGSNTCFYGKCLYCKNQASGVCANGTLMEGAVILWLPKTFQFQQFRHPWSRTYKAGKKARWETDEEHYCDAIRRTELYKTGPLLMDIIDTCVFDFLIGNADRHHFEIFSNDSSSILIMFDNGKSFGNAWHDEQTILAPLLQCRQIRASTVQKLRDMAGGVLSRVLRQVIVDEPIAPLISEPHYKAIDRRLAIVLHTIDSMIRSSSPNEVLIVDGYS